MSMRFIMLGFFVAAMAAADKGHGPKVSSEDRWSRRARAMEFVLQKLKAAFNGSDDTTVVISLSVDEAQQCHAGDVRKARA